MSEVEKCPKCDGEMAKGTLNSYPHSFRLLKSGDWRGDIIQAFYCEDCGYLEFYKETKEKSAQAVVIGRRRAKLRVW
jgi:predicted nucleic-acid-binding Zn-ribbon protein